MQVTKKGSALSLTTAIGAGVACVNKGYLKFHKLGSEGQPLEHRDKKTYASLPYSESMKICICPYIYTHKCKYHCEVYYVIMMLSSLFTVGNYGGPYSIEAVGVLV